MSHASTLRTLIAGTTGNPLVLPGVGSPLEALSAESAGFQSIYISGYAVAAWRHGLPDIGLLGVTDTGDALAAISRVVSLPIIVDADTGYGGPASVHSNIRLLESLGAAAIQIEDQTWPKKCGHMRNKEVISAEDAAKKIAAAVEARTNPDTVIIARTDAIGPHGLDEALKRARMFRDAGADVLFLDAPESIEELTTIGKQLDGPLMVNMSEGGLTPAMSATEFHALGFGIVAFPTAALRVAAKSFEQLFSDLMKYGDTRAWSDRMFTLDALNQLVDLEKYVEIDKKTLR
ncbi:MAG: isocitrate lyase/phosphoenolpyruvate mutase family protein [Candidatus Nanopelagicaceae bacterium]